jgi:hypothetical protein
LYFQKAQGKLAKIAQIPKGTYYIFSAVRNALFTVFYFFGKFNLQANARLALEQQLQRWLLLHL